MSKPDETIKKLLAQALENAAPHKSREHISPEGVEEKVMLEYRFFITQTQGGKYRSYISGGEKDAKPLTVTASLFAILHSVSDAMAMSAMLLTAATARLGNVPKKDRS